MVAGGAGPFVQRWAVDGAGTQCVGADAFRHVVESHRFGEADDRCLGRHVGQAIGHPMQGRGDGGDVDDGRAAIGNKVRQEGLGQDEHRGYVDVEARLPIGERGVFQHPLMHPAGAVVEHIDVGVGGCGGFQRRMIGHVDDDGLVTGIGIEAAQRLPERRDCHRVAVGGDNPGALARESQGRRPADAGGRGSHECNFPLEPAQCSPRC